jgi:hypothetical protein
MSTCARQDVVHLGPGDGAAAFSRAPAGGRRTLEAVTSDAGFQGAVLLMLALLGLLVGAQRFLSL